MVAEVYCPCPGEPSQISVHFVTFLCTMKGVVLHYSLPEIHMHLIADHVSAL